MKLSCLLATVAAIATTVSNAAPESVEELNKRVGVDGRIEFRADTYGEPIVRMSSTAGYCDVRLRGAHIHNCVFTADKHPLLFSPSKGYEEKPAGRTFLHGGVPLLWPWFGGVGAPKDPSWRKRLRKWGFPVKAEAPFHATSRYSLFTVRSVDTKDPAVTKVTLGLRQCPEVAEYTEGEFDLEYTITLANLKLTLSLKTTNLGDAPFTYREGYHPYYAVSDCFDVTLDGFDGCPYESTRDLPNDVKGIWKGTVRTWPGCDIFKFKTEKSKVILTDPNWKRRIILDTTGAKDVVTWCQDIKGTKRGTSNIKPEEARRYMCIEPSNFHDSSEITLKKGESHVFTMVSRIEPMEVVAK